MNTLTKKEIIDGYIADQMVDPMALEEVRLAVLTMMKKYFVGAYVSAAQLLPYEQWLKMGPGERSRFGQRLSLLIEIGELPLVRAEPVGVTNHYLIT